MKKYEILLFDLDDTLISNLENVRYAYSKMEEYLGFSYSDEGFKKWYELDKQFWEDFHNNKIIVPIEYKEPQELFVKYVRSLRYQIYFDNSITIEKAFEINELFLKSLNEVVVPIEGACETLEYLSKKYKIVIATNGPTVAVQAKLSKIGCFDYVNAIFSADMTKKTITKPNKEFFEELKHYLEFYQTEKMMIIGDSLKQDVKGGMNSDIDSCWLNSNNEMLEEGYEPKIVINKLKELKKIL